METGVSRILNLNLGILGHIDSGKTSLAKALSTLHSTASFDKSPQSQERGITLDLGFSAFLVDKPADFEGACDKIQFTLVDCPGHASLIRTIIGGASIIDLMMLVVDITKGIQTQTAEGLVIGEILCDRLVVVLNKLDLVPPADRAKHVERMRAGLRKTLAATKFASCPMVEVAASPAAAGGTQPPPVGLSELVRTLLATAALPERTSAERPFVFAVDHCFAIKGQGSVMTGTVLSGSVELNQTIELPRLKLQKKVKSMQMFHRPVQRASQGDRVGICVTQLDSKLLERGLVADPGYISAIQAAVMPVQKIRFFKGQIKTRSKVHVTVGHETVMATVSFFAFSKAHLERLRQTSAHPVGVLPGFDVSCEYEFRDELSETNDDNPAGSQFVLIEFESEVNCPPNSVIIGSRLDTDIHSKACRLAFFGKLSHPFADKAGIAKLRIFKLKTKEGGIDRLVDDRTLIGKNMFKKETPPDLYVNLKVQRSSNGDVGTIESSFGKSGKFKVVFPNGGQTDTHGTLVLHFKKYVFSETKKLIQ
eukprot:TRINITY_DN7450_c0_g1_i1.p1 TRINITY_DN7450_c0_g1~~TRINITY_DN7450_c0_g1_i1.p1  ORF type:complete len:536 (-),score=121.64 TRINITY_DN7450_c0_g1_i1:6-1613(-)